MARRHARVSGILGFALAASIPALLWHRPIELVASDFRLELGYLITGWTGYCMIGGGLRMMAAVAFTSGLNAKRRPRRRNPYIGWGLSLYLLGATLASQVAAVAGG
jgi:hypothetical protein